MGVFLFCTKCHRSTEILSESGGRGMGNFTPDSKIQQIALYILLVIVWTYIKAKNFIFKRGKR